MQGKDILLWLFQVVAGGILLWAGGIKFMAGPSDIFIFTELGMEPVGRVLIGTIEVTAAAMLLTRSYSALGGLLGLGVMFGATIAHISVLGLTVQGDDGLHVGLLSTVVLCTTTVLVARRKTLPFIGSTL